MNQNRRYQIAADLVLLIPTIIWALNYSIVKRAMVDWSESKFLFLSCRFLIATLVFLPLIIATWSSIKKDLLLYLKSGFMIAVALTISYSFQTSALIYTSASKTAFISSLSIVLVPILGYLLFRNKVSKNEIAGVIVAVIGLALLTLKVESQFNRGDAFAFVSALGLAIDIILIGIYSKKLSAIGLTFFSTLFMSFMMFVLFTFWESKNAVPALTNNVLFAIVFTGLIATALSFWIQAKAQSHTTSTHAAIIFSFEPPVAAILGWYLGEVMTIKMLIGCAMMFIATLLVELKISNR